MSRWEKALLIALPLALLLTAACRFIEHTDREYAYWINLYGDSVAWLDARCTELSTPGACSTAQDRRRFLTSLEDYRERVNHWGAPALVLTAMAWAMALASLVAVVRQYLRRRR